YDGSVGGAAEARNARGGSRVLLGLALYLLLAIQPLGVALDSPLLNGGGYGLDVVYLLGYVLVGWLVGRWWVVLIPLTALLWAVPFDLLDVTQSDSTAIGIALIDALFLLPAVALGVGLRLLPDFVERHRVER